MRFGGKGLTIGLTSALVLVIGAGGLFLWNDRAQETHFCKASLAMLEINGKTVIPQDQTGPTEDPACDFDETEDAYSILGFDCRIRKPDGTVTVELVPNRDDGTCGLPGLGEEIPDPWLEA